MRFSRLIFRVVFVVIMIFGVGFASDKALAFDPQNLVGEWVGEWKIPRLSDAFYMSIKKVVQDRVEGTVYIRGPAPYHNRDIEFVGTLAGNTFTTTTPTQAGSPPITWSLEIDDSGAKMTGYGVGTVRIGAFTR